MGNLRLFDCSDLFVVTADLSIILLRMNPSLVYSWILGSMLKGLELETPTIDKSSDDLLSVFEKTVEFCLLYDGTI